MSGKAFVQYYDHINVLIKPTDGCNLRCKYCFHQDFGYNPQKMSLGILEHFFSITMPHYRSMTIIWHGGEPTFVGKDCFARYSGMAIEHAKEHETSLKQSMQTNGTLLTQSFIDVLKQNNISLGISYDGPVNDITRNSSKKFLEADSLLRKNGIEYGTIAVISGMNVHSLPDLYIHMKELGRDYQMNPFIDTSENALQELHMTATGYLNAMSELYSVWLEDKECNIHVDPFMRMIHDCYTGHSSLCARSSCMRNWFCLNADGLLSPCDRDFPVRYCYGNVMDYTDIRQLYDSDGYKELISQAIRRRALCQSSCDVYPLCEGGCNNNAFYENGLDQNGGTSCMITKGLLHMIRDSIEQRQLFSDAPKAGNPVLLNWLKKQQMSEKL